MFKATLIGLALISFVTSAHAQSKEQWIELGTRIHGGFGALVPIGIRIGLDAKERLKSEPRGLAVRYFTGERSPCPCIADGVMIATGASPGQGTLQIATEKAPAGTYAVIVVHNRKTGEALRYTISSDWGDKIIEWNKSFDPSGRYDAVMNAEGLFQVSSNPN